MNPDAAESTTDQQPVAAGSSSPDLEPDAQKPKGPSPVGFAQGTKEELAKVVWPDRQQLISESAAVILMVSFLAIFISLIDNVFSWASRLVF
ncbi:preprotein translocase subunit SecE [Acaryochloris thomasi]|uniref:preprotein translocase subunit SecE n=1 Tax=Acaryochloris thomasi TaxID=2929456 RepID=UPI000DA6CD1F